MIWESDICMIIEAMRGKECMCHRLPVAKVLQCNEFAATFLSFAGLTTYLDAAFWIAKLMKMFRSAFIYLKVTHQAVS